MYGLLTGFLCRWIVYIQVTGQAVGEPLEKIRFMCSRVALLAGRFEFVSVLVAGNATDLAVTTLGVIQLADHPAVAGITGLGGCSGCIPGYLGRFVHRVAFGTAGQRLVGVVRLVAR